MKICVAQTRPVTGDIQRNIEAHKKLIDLAVLMKANTIIFPELSLTGYEPTLAKTLATHPEDSRFKDFQKTSDAHQLTIGVGVPIKHKAGTCISMVLFQPNQERKTYSKKYLHADEEPYFIPGQNVSDFLGDHHGIALAICYELSVPAHAENAFAKGANVYLASVAKFENGIDKATQRLSHIAQTYGMTVSMANSVGPADG
ncbi:carbon-nitrogen hydrolase family protein [Rufibacter tibetensis]|uniref:carbon-nitrogen hydrolase family protein n=1 Tax=Rufibacter tibetensis TaxID=512763 RepID=UPI000AF37B7F|nr:carbon-nitrogen hydrolase family protein [Rufibacter tibetensis]